MSLLTNVFYNNITPGIDEKNSKVKKLFDKIHTSKILSLDSVSRIKNDFFFKERFQDIISVLPKNKSNINLLRKHHYKETKQKEFRQQPYNCIIDESYIDYIKKTRNTILEEIELKGTLYHYFTQENYIVFYDVESSQTKYFFQIDGYKIHDVVLTDDYFMYLLISMRDKQYLVKTHIGQNFASLNEEHEYIEFKECVFSIPVANYIKYNTIEHIEFNEVFLRNEQKISKLTLGKKYYFTDYKNIYFNYQDELEAYKNNFVQELQDNYSNVYNRINFLGLNDFQILNRKVSTHELNVFQSLFKHKFDNTLNGGINYFLIRNAFSDVRDENGFLFKIKPDYHLDIQDEYVSIVGNFVNEYQKGNYSIMIQDGYVSLLKVDSKTLNSTFIEKTKLIDGHCYFFNLFIQTKKRELPNFPIFYSFSANDPYPFKQEFIQLKLESIPNNHYSLHSFLQSKIIHKHQETSFQNNNIIFKNEFQWYRKKYLFGHNQQKIKANEPFHLQGIQNYITNVPYDIKNNFLIPRDNGIIYYATTDSFKIPLVTENGYISDFWKKYQGTQLFFCCTDTVNITEKSKAQYSCYVPSIEKYLKINDSSYSNVFVKTDDELEVALPFHENLLITDKYLEEPLFYKVFIEASSQDEIEIYNSDDNKINNILYQPYKNGFVCYFNKEQKKKYYYHTNHEKFIYFEPLKALNNIQNIYNFEKNGFASLKNVYVKAISVMSKKNLSIFRGVLYFYNYQDNIVKRMAINENNLNKMFDLNLQVDKILLETEEEIDKDNFYILESDNTSYVFNNTINYFKADRNSICYFSDEIPEISLHKILSQPIKVNTRYIVQNGKIVENQNGYFYISDIIDNGVAILPIKENIHEISKNVFANISISPEKDKYYIDNFKTSGNYYINIKTTNKTITTNNQNFEISREGE